MAIILGAATQVTSPQFTGGGFVSVQWGISPQINRLWQLGSWQPYNQLATRAIEFNVTAYAGAGPDIALAPADACEDSTALLSITIDVAACGDLPDDLDGTYTVFINSFSYDKSDAVGFGQQSYAGQSWPGGAGSGDHGVNVEWTDAPTYVIQGISEGNETADDDLETGVTFSSDWDVYGNQGSVSAGALSLGQANTIRHGLVSQISNGDLKNDGKIGSASVTIPHTPLYMG